MGSYKKYYRCYECKKIYSKMPKDNVCRKCGDFNRFKEIIAKYEFMLGYKDKNGWRLK